MRDRSVILLLRRRLRVVIEDGMDADGAVVVAVVDFRCADTRDKLCLELADEDRLRGPQISFKAPPKL